MVRRLKKLNPERWPRETDPAKKRPVGRPVEKPHRKPTPALKISNAGDKWERYKLTDSDRTKAQETKKWNQQIMFLINRTDFFNLNDLITAVKQNEIMGKVLSPSLKRRIQKAIIQWEIRELKQDIKYQKKLSRNRQSEFKD